MCRQSIVPLTIALVALVWIPRAAVAQGALTNGGNHTGSISAAGELDSWTFTASQNDSITLAIGEILPAGPDPGFFPWIRLRNPSGVQIATSSGALAAQISIAAPLTGTYTVIVGSADSFNDALGDYRLTLARIPGAFDVPAGDQGGTMTNGRIHTGSIHVGDLDMWSFTAAQNDFIVLAIGEVLPGGTDPGFNPWIRLVGPTGTLVANASGILAAHIAVAAPLSGTYTVIVSTADSFNDAVGDYQLTLAKSPGTFEVPPGDHGGPLTNGRNHSGSIFIGDVDMWSFTAAQNEYIALSIGEPDPPEIDPGFNPWIRLIGPTGAVVGNSSGVRVGQISLNAPLSGTYTVIVGTADSFGDAAGDYVLTLMKAPGTIEVPIGDEGGTLTNGLNHLGHIHEGDLDPWTFTAAQNDYISLSIGEPPFGEVDPGFNPWIRLIGPTGAVVAQSTGILVGQIHTNAPLSGTYTVIVGTGDSFNDAEGNYRLTLAKAPGMPTVPDEAPNPSEPTDNHGGGMTNGAIHTGNIRVGDLDQWTFTAAAGDLLALSIGEQPDPPEIDPGFNPWIRLIGPTGTLLANASGIRVAQITVTATLTGTYTVIVGTADSFNDATGPYWLTLAKVPGTFTVSAGDQGGAMAPGALHEGTIYEGDLDQWTFSTSQGRSITVTITEPEPPEIDPGFNPWIRLVSPTGTILASASGALTAQINVTAPLTGLYTVLVGTADSFNDAEGAYRLTALFTPISTNPTMTLDKTSLRFGAVTNGASLLWQTPPQLVRLTQGGPGTVTWTATPSQPWLHVSPASGTGTATVSVSVGFVPGVSGTMTGSVAFTFSGAANNPGPISVALNVLQNGTPSGPFGNVDTPTNNRTGITGAVPFTGWALDDVGIDRVAICRAPFGAEIASPNPNCGGASHIFLGFGVMIDGARPDVAAAFPSYPANSIGGWGFMVLTNMLPNQGNGTYVFFIYAQDREGAVTLLGTRTMTCANAQATLPFGAIDTPGQGGVASGAGYLNFGWALTPQPKTIPTDGSTITVLVDGLSVGTVTYNNFRSDIATLFPGFNNTNGAVGFKVIDTTTLANGTHTIVWVATDNAGATQGIRSRFFSVSNGAALMTAVTTAAAQPPLLTTAQISALPLADTAVLARRGWDLDTAYGSYAPSGFGRVTLRGEEIDRFEIALGARAGTTHTGYLRAAGELSPLPIGSSLDEDTGTFTWAPGVGFIGNYDLVFVRWNGMAPVERREVRIVVQPKGRGAVGPQVVIDVPRAQQDVAQPFMVAGWAADLDAAAGTGVSTLHAWAYPLAGGAPIFLGAAHYGGRRPDVATAHGEQFRDAGYGFIVDGLVPGNYDVAVFAASSVTGSFVPARTVRVTVR